jgi:RNA ligase (TIGR02306 family)
MKLASIESITSIKHHSNADALDIVGVLGYECITVRDRYRVGDRVVFIQPDTVLPDKEWAQVFKKKSSRVRAIKLRGEWSFGIVMGLTEVDSSVDLSTVEVGTDISAHIGVFKYEPPAPTSLDAKGNLPYNIQKTDEERFQNLIDKLPMGERVDVTLKIDGQSATYYAHKDPSTGEWTTGVTSRTLEIKPESNNNYTRIEKKYNIMSKLLEYCKANDVSLALRGEIYGNNIQNFSKNPHAKGPLDFAVFSVFNFNTMRHENPSSLFFSAKVAKALEIPHVPFVQEAQSTTDHVHTTQQILSEELINFYQKQINQIDGKPFEGVVVRHEKGSFKIINLDYDSNK